MKRCPYGLDIRDGPKEGRKGLKARCGGRRELDDDGYDQPPLIRVEPHG
jgi:hypothetical protein